MFYTTDNTFELLPVALLTIEKPWGKFEQFTHNTEATVKIITVAPESALSLQYHQKRDELWRALSGSGEIVLNDARYPFLTDDMAWIPRLTRHRILTTHSPLTILEISFGTFDERDIVRIEDAYERDSATLG
jgi:mannose-6-phosphate isomerase